MYVFLLSNLQCSWLLDSGADGQTIVFYTHFMDIECPDAVAFYDGKNVTHLKITWTQVFIRLYNQRFVFHGEYFSMVCLQNICTKYFVIVSININLSILKA